MPALTADSGARGATSSTDDDGGARAKDCRRTTFVRGGGYEAGVSGAGCCCDTGGSRCCGRGGCKTGGGTGAGGVGWYDAPVVSAGSGCGGGGGGGGGGGCGGGTGRRGAGCSGAAGVGTGITSDICGTLAGVVPPARAFCSFVIAIIVSFNFFSFWSCFSLSSPLPRPNAPKIDVMIEAQLRAASGLKFRKIKMLIAPTTSTPPEITPMTMGVSSIGSGGGGGGGDGGGGGLGDG